VIASRSPESWLTRLQALPRKNWLKQWFGMNVLQHQLLETKRASERQKIKRELLIKQNQVRAIPLVWASTTARSPFVNLGDALSPVIVSALSGLPVVHQHFDADANRFASVGTIGHGLKNGVVHLWGTGVDRKKNPIDSTLNYYKRPLDTLFRVHALRGPFSADTFQRQGITVPDIYGDPVWFLPSIMPPAPEKQYELGVIVHLSELAEYTDTASVKSHFLRYHIPESLTNQIRIITTVTQPSYEALEAKVQEITACKRIASTSLHGLVIAEAYRIPCLYFRTKGRGTTFMRLEEGDDFLDLRVRDFYSGMGLKRLFVYGQARRRETPWEKVINTIDQYWNPIDWSGDRFLDAFPLPLAYNPLGDRSAEQSVDRSLLQAIQF
jgi:pyruvyltransferase